MADVVYAIYAKRFELDGDMVNMYNGCSGGIIGSPYPFDMPSLQLLFVLRVPWEEQEDVIHVDVTFTREDDRIYRHPLATAHIMSRHVPRRREGKPNYTRVVLQLDAFDVPEPGQYAITLSLNSHEKFWIPLEAALDTPADD